MSEEIGSASAGSPTGGDPGSQGSVQPAATWRDGLSPDLRDSPYISRLDSIEALAKEHVNAQKLIGKKGVIPPDEKGTPDDWNRFYNSLGRPESPDKYNLSGVKVPEGVPWDADFQSDILSTLHAAGATQKQAEAVLKGMIEKQTSRWNEYSSEVGGKRDSGLQALKSEWGSAYASKLDLANRAYSAAFGDKGDAVRNLVLADGTLLGDSPEVIRAFAELGDKLKEHGLAEGGSSSRASVTPDEAKAQIASMLADPDINKALNDRSHPEHEFATKKKAALYAAAYPEVV